MAECRDHDHAGKAPLVEGEGVDWTCPMHPQVVRLEPGSCPICGMALDPCTVAPDRDEASPELADMMRRFWIAAAFTVPRSL